MMYIIREQKSRCHALPLESIDSKLQVTPAPASRCFRALFARKPELNGVNTLEECVACSESALESPNATFHGHTLVRV